MNIVLQNKDFLKSENHKALQMRGLLKRDRLTQKQVYEEYFSQMVKIPMRYTSSIEDAYEILNEAFLKVFNTIEKYKGTGSFGGWISKIVFYTTIDHVRKNSSFKKHHLHGGDFQSGISIQNTGLQNLVVEDIYKHIQSLSENERIVFSMYAIDGYKHKEISEILDIPISTSKWHLQNARKSLQKLLKELRYE